MPGEPGTEAEPVRSAPPWTRYLAPAFPLIIVVGYVINCVVAIGGDSGPAKPVLLDQGMSWLIGAFMVGASVPHIIWPRVTAASIGWATSPFQWEVAWADLAIGVLGFMASGGDRELIGGAVVVFAIFNYAAVAGHLRELVRRHNTAPGNFGVMFFYSILAPAWLIWLYVSTR